jgi:hypothetical protein
MQKSGILFPLVNFYPPPPLGRHLYPGATRSQSGQGLTPPTANQRAAQKKVPDFGNFLMILLI